MTNEQLKLRDELNRQYRREYIYQRRKNMTQEQREAYNAYQRRYRAAHKDKVREWREDYIIRKAEKLKKAKEE